MKKILGLEAPMEFTSKHFVYYETRFQAMSSIFSMIKEIDGSREILMIGVRVAYIQFVENEDKPTYLEMVLMD